MKKLLSIFAAIVIVLTMILSVHADSGLDLGDDSEKKVTATYESGVSETVYSVDIAWQGMSFTYIAGDAGLWDPETHTYGPSSADDWAPSDAKITVTNHSNSAILASFKYEYDPAYNSAYLLFDTTKLVVPSAETNARAEVGSVRVEPQGSLSEAATGGRIGKIIVTIAPAVDITTKTAADAAVALIDYFEVNKGGAADPFEVPVVSTSTPAVTDLASISDALCIKYSNTVKINLNLFGVTIIPDADKQTNKSAFCGDRYNTWLQSVVLYDARVIGESGFAYCLNLESVDAPKTIELRSNLFASMGGSKLTTVQFGSALTSVSPEAFANNSNLSNVTLYLSADQMAMKRVTTNNIATWIPTEESYWTSDEYQNKTFCGYTFKEIKIYERYERGGEE